jgi:hypothetical protein
MNVVLERIAKRQTELLEHSLFAKLRGEASLHRGLSFAPRLGLWVIAFQDVLRINEQQIRDPLLRRIARHHRAEDAGHERWYLQDLATLGGDRFDLAWLYEKRLGAARIATHQIVAETYRATDDTARIALLLSLEGAGHVFFGEVAGFVARTGGTSRLKYFSSYHLDLEKGHEMFERKMMSDLAEFVLSPAQEAECLAVVERVFDAFDGLFLDFAFCLEGDAAAPRATGQAESTA